MDCWCYGLIKDEKLKLVEIYWADKNKPWAYAHLSLWQYFKDFFMIISDIISQLKNHHIIDAKEFK